MTRSGPDFPERMEFGWSRVPEQPVPCVGSNSHHAGKAGFEVAKFDRANQRGEVCAKRSHGRAIVRAGIYRHDQEDRDAGEGCRYGLWNNHSVNL
jgi:hypothetical protein